jgi:hypothetical protein
MVSWALGCKKLYCLLIPSSSSQLTQYQLAPRRHGVFGYPKTERYCLSRVCYEMTRQVTKSRLFVGLVLSWMPAVVQPKTMNTRLPLNNPFMWQFEIEKVRPKLRVCIVFDSIGRPRPLSQDSAPQMHTSVQCMYLDHCLTVWYNRFCFEMTRQVTKTRAVNWAEHVVDEQPIRANLQWSENT